MDNQITATYDSDSKRYHLFLIDMGQVITGTIYVPKNESYPRQRDNSLQNENRSTKED